MLPVLTKMNACETLFIQWSNPKKLITKLMNNRLILLTDWLRLSNCCQMLAVTDASYIVSSFTQGIKNSSSSSSSTGKSDEESVSSSVKPTMSESNVTFSQSVTWQSLHATTHSKPCLWHEHSMLLIGRRLETWHLHHTTFKMLSGATGSAIV